MRSFFGLGAALIVLLTASEVWLVHTLAPWAQWVGVRILSLRGVFPSGRPPAIGAVSGFQLREVRAGTYLVRPVEWPDRLARLDSGAPWTVAFLEVRGSSWALHVRQSVGVVLCFSVVAVALIIKAASEQFTIIGWSAALAWTVFVMLALLQQGRRAKSTFARFAHWLEHASDV